MILPTFTIFMLFMLYPIVSTIVLGFQSWDGIGDKTFVGFGNYVQALTSPIVLESFFNNLKYCLGLIFFGMIPGLLLAYLLSGNIHGRTFFRTIFFFPRLCSMVIVSLVWGWIYNPIFGVINKLLSLISGSVISIAWLGNANTAMFSVALTGGWTYFGYCMVIYLAAFQSTNPSLTEAALMDGANPFQIFFSVVLPQILEVNIMVLVLTVIDAFKIFDIIYLMTGGGPGRKTEIMATLLYREAFRHNHFGYGASIAVILTVTILAISLIIQKIQAKD